MPIIGAVGPRARCYNAATGPAGRQVCARGLVRKDRVTPRTDAPLAGFFRVVYLLAAAVVSVMVVVTAIVSFYEPPAEEQIGFPQGRVVVADRGSAAREDYNRNVTLILTTTSAGVFAVAILGLGSRFNPLRAGLVLGGLGMYLAGISFWASSSDQWIGFILTLIVFGVLALGFPWLEEGLPIGGVLRARVPPPPPARPPLDEEPPHPPI